MSEYIAPVIKKIRYFNVRYYAAWAIEARETLEDRGWMKWIDPAKQLKADDGSDDRYVDIAEGLGARSLLLQSIGSEHKSRIRDRVTAVDIWSALEDKFAYKSGQDEPRFKAQLNEIPQDPR
jgi:hypothetical protein